MMTDVPIKIINKALFQARTGVYNPVDGYAYRRDLDTGTACWLDYERTLLQYVCPCGCHATNTIPVGAKDTDGWGGKLWLWDGRRFEPTLTPSIQQYSACRWHGYLTAGVWKTA